MSSWTPHSGKQDAPATFETLSSQLDDLGGGIDRLRNERDRLREALQEAIDVFEGMHEDEIDDQLLPRLRAAMMR